MRKKNDNLIHFFSHNLDTKLRKSLLLIFVAIKTRKWRYNAQLLQRKKKTNQKTNKRDLSRYKAKLSTINAKLFYRWIDGDQHVHAPKIRIFNINMCLGPSIVVRAKYWKVVHVTVSVWKQCYMYIIYSSISDMIQLISVHLLLMVSSMIQSMQNAKIGERERADILVPLLSSILTHLLGLFHKWVYLRLVTKCITLFQGCLSLV